MAEEVKIDGSRVLVKTGDITKEEVDAIVNAANSSLAGGGGVDGAIHRAGGPSIMAECRKIDYCPVGQAVVTGGGDLKARYVIHTVGPVWRGGGFKEKRLLESAYTESLKRARELGIKTMSFPSISTGAYAFPMNEAALIALKAINTFIKANPGPLEEVRMVLFNQQACKVFEHALHKIKKTCHQ